MTPVRPIYLDYAATTPVDTRVLQAMRPFLQAKFYNPSSLYQLARQVRQELESARAKVAQNLGARPTEIIFSSGATESVNLTMFGLAQEFKQAGAVVSGIEHPAVLKSAQAAFGKNATKICAVKTSGIIDLVNLEELITDKTVIVSVMYANNEVGTIQPLAKIAKLIADVRSQRSKRKVDLPLYFHTDASQAANYLDLHVHRLGVDLLTLNGSKIYAPKQTGATYIKTGTKLAPWLQGGGQEMGLRSGTENVAGAVGFAMALSLATEIRPTENRRLTKLRNYAFAILPNQIPGLSINGDTKVRLPNNIHISIPGLSGEMLVHSLDGYGVLVATGSACSANHTEASHVLSALGLNNRAITSSLRITMGRLTTKPQIDYFIERLKLSVKELSQVS